MDIQKIEKIAQTEMAGLRCDTREPGWVLYHSKKLGSIFRLNQNGNSINSPGLEWNEVATKVMDLLMERGVPYHEGIKGLIQDLEFHYPGFPC
jgi:hypothetical protein